MTASIRYTAPSAALEFEHLVQINDPADPRITPLTVEQLWRGLVLRMQYPQQFQPGIERVEITRLGADEWLRLIDFGQTQVRDRVQFTELRLIEVEVLGVELQARLAIRIETPTAAALNVRFSYHTQSPDHRADAPLGGYIRDAWRQADEETVFRIRQLAASGVLDTVD